MRIELAIPQDFLDLLSAVGGIYYGNITTPSIKAISTNSKECKEGDVFFAIAGRSFDGNMYIQEAIDKGAIPVGTNVRRFGIKVNSGSSALLSFASFYKDRLPQLKHTFAITGSVGKTSTKEMLKMLSSVRYKTHATWENFNNDIGLSYTILSASADTEILIAELGMNNAGEISELSKALKPDSAVITKIGSAHIGNLGSIENIALAKLEIIHGLCGNLTIPCGEPLLQTDYPNISHFSSSGLMGNVSIIKNSFGQTELYINGSLEYIFDFHSYADHLRHCLAAAICSSMNIGLTISDMIKGINAISESSFRHRIVQSKRGFFILDDSYNASYESVLASISMLLKLDEKGRKSILLGDILELGSMSHDIHFKIGQMIGKESDIIFLFLIGNEAKYIIDGAIDAGFEKRRIFYNPDTKSPEITASQICRNLTTDDMILAKASHKTNVKRIIDLIE